MKANIKSITTLLFVFILIANMTQEVKAENYFVADVMDCITKVSCVSQYRVCAADQTCSGILNAQSSCRINNKCNQNSKLIWDPNCYLKCVQVNKNTLYNNLVKCSSEECHAQSQILKPAMVIIVLLSFIFLLV